MKLKTYKGAKGKADRLFSEIIRTEGECERCGSRDWIQCAHIISRRYNGVRTDLRNAFALCAKCHRFFTDHPREFSRFITDTWAQNYYDQIFELARPNSKIDWNQRVEFLTDIKRQIASGLTLAEAREMEQ